MQRKPEWECWVKPRKQTRNVTRMEARNLSALPSIGYCVSATSLSCDLGNDLGTRTRAILDDCLSVP